jgi:molybdopterin adenylyltransferase
MITAAVLTISDKGAKGQRKDESGALVADMLAKAGYAVEKQDVVPDDEQNCQVPH